MQDLPDGVVVRPGKGQLDRVSVDTAACTGEVYLHGAHVTAFQPEEQLPLLWVSSKSAFAPGQAIRGGIPICFPWFGPMRTDLDFHQHEKPPQHGVARTSPWRLTDVRRSADAVTLSLSPASHDPFSKWWPGKFAATLAVRFAKTLTVALRIENRGTTPMRCEAALHTYFFVGDVNQVEVHGLEGVEYVDRVRDLQRFKQDNTPIRFDGEFDRTYVNTSSPVTVIDPVYKRKIVNQKVGSNTTVVWNPGRVKAEPVIGLAPDEYKQFVCVETAAATDNFLTINPGETHTLGFEASSETL